MKVGQEVELCTYGAVLGESRVVRRGRIVEVGVPSDFGNGTCYVVDGGEILCRFLMKPVLGTSNYLCDGNKAYWIRAIGTRSEADFW